MQRPTLQNVRIRSTCDAHLVFNAVARNILPLIVRRLDAEERRAIVPGNVYVWEERGTNWNTESTAGLGMERWTDGRSWGPSRVRDEFLFYHQKESDPVEDVVGPTTPWAQTVRKREQASSRSTSIYPSSIPRLANESERLVKQTYSVHVSLPADRSRGVVRKWHLTAYFSQQNLDSLNTIDNIKGVGDVIVPEGWFKGARASKSRREFQNIPSHFQPPLVGVIDTSVSANSVNPHAYSKYPGPPYNYRSSSPTSSDNSWASTSVSSPSASSSSRIESCYPNQLVPLQYLQNVSVPHRDPADEQLLKRFCGGAPST